MRLFKGNSVEVLLNKGTQHLRSGNLTKALESFKAAADQEPSNTEALFHIGLIQIMGGHFEAALGFYDKLVEIEPDSERNWNNRAICLAQLRKQADALKNFDRALALNPSYLQALSGKADTLLSMASEPTITRGENGMPIVAHNTQELELALDYYNRIINQAPQSIPAYIGKVWCLKLLDRKNDAKFTLDKVLELDSTNQQALHLQAQLMF